MDNDGTKLAVAILVMWLALVFFFFAFHPGGVVNVSTPGDMLKWLMDEFNNLTTGNNTVPDITNPGTNTGSNTGGDNTGGVNQPVTPSTGFNPHQIPQYAIRGIVSGIESDVGAATEFAGQGYAIGRIISALSTGNLTAAKNGLASLGDKAKSTLSDILGQFGIHL